VAERGLKQRRMHVPDMQRQRERLLFIGADCGQPGLRNAGK
jgi:hypothetical protein